MVVMHTSMESWVLYSDVVKHYMRCLGRQFSWFTKKSPVVPNVCHRSEHFILPFSAFCAYTTVPAASVDPEVFHGIKPTKAKVLVQYILCNVQQGKVIHAFAICCAAR